MGKPKRSMIVDGVAIPYKIPGESFERRVEVVILSGDCVGIGFFKPIAHSDLRGLTVEEIRANKLSLDSGPGFIRRKNVRFNRVILSKEAYLALLTALGTPKIVEITKNLFKGRSS